MEENKKQDNVKKVENTEKDITEIEKRLETFQSANLKMIEKMEQLEELYQKKSIPVTKDIVAEQKTIIETNPVLRKSAPFIQISKEIESFVMQVKSVITGIDSRGGILVPEEFRAEVIKYATENAVIRPRARIFNMARDTLSLPTLDQTADHFGGITFAYAGESTTIARSNPLFGKITLNVRKLTGMVDISNEMINDSAIGIANFLTVLFGAGLAYHEDRDFLTGTGVTRPLGIIRDERVPTITRTTAARITILDITRMYETLPAFASGRAEWFTTKAGIGQLLRMRADAVAAGDSAGAMLFLPSMQAGVPSLLHGKPIIETDKLPAVGTRGDIFLGDVSNYFIGDRGGIEVASSIHDRFAEDMTTLRFIRRIDGQVAIPRAFVVLV